MPTMNSKVFYDRIRETVFGGRISPRQFDGLQRIMKFWDLAGGKDPRHLCYVLATVRRESPSFQPVREIGLGKGHPYGLADPRTGHAYYGRGLVQLTWYDNYAKMEKLSGIPFITQPDLALEWPAALYVLFEGMFQGISQRGDFTKYSLEDFINSETENPVGARRIVNGLDHAEEISQTYYSFKSAMLEAGVVMNPLLLRGAMIAIGQVLPSILGQLNLSTAVVQEVTRETQDAVIAHPEVQDAAQPKPAVQSLGVWGGLIALVASGLAVYTGVELTVDETASISAMIAGAIGGIGAIVSIVGRIKAKQPVVGVVSTKGKL